MEALFEGHQIVILTREGLVHYSYHLQTKLWEGNVFTRVCLFTEGVCHGAGMLPL